MIGSYEALASASQGQNASLGVPPSSAPRALAWEGFRRRNTLLDTLFYDVKRLSNAEAELLGAIGIVEGSILLVPPSGAGEVVACPTIDDFITAGGTAATSLAISGVGSSALGAAAFARNIADATGEPACAVVSGYGLSDLVTEALGGWLWFGTINRLRHIVEASEPHVLPAPKPDTGTADKTTGKTIGLADGFISRDTQTAFGLLCDERLDFSLLTGHSKGNLVMSEALYAFVDWCRNEDRPAGLDRLIVTFSATIAVPPVFRNIVDVMGGADPLGRLNSRWDIPIEKLVGLRGHHTNTDIPGHLPVTRELRGILAERRQAPRSAA